MKINITQNTQEGHLESRTHNVCVFCTRPSWIRPAFVFLTRSKNQSHTLSRKKLHNELLSCQCSLALLMERMTLHSHTYIYLHTHTCACRHRIGVCVCVWRIPNTSLQSNPTHAHSHNFACLPRRKQQTSLCAEECFWASSSHLLAHNGVHSSE